jgi:hypothetical protein
VEHQPLRRSHQPQEAVVDREQADRKAQELPQRCQEPSQLRIALAVR